MLGLQDNDASRLNESDLGNGLTDKEAVKIIMNNLEHTLQLKEDHFKD